VLINSTIKGGRFLIRFYLPLIKKEERKLMCPDRLSFLTKFDKFYHELVNLAREDKISESEFYMIIIAKAKAMDRERLDQKKRI